MGSSSDTEKTQRVTVADEKVISQQIEETQAEEDKIRQFSAEIPKWQFDVISQVAKATKRSKKDMVSIIIEYFCSAEATWLKSFDEVSLPEDLKSLKEIKNRFGI